MSNESDLSYVSKSILNVMPDAIDLSKEIKYSSYVTKREYVDVFPSNAGSTITVTSSNLGSSTKIILADPSRWLDRRNSSLILDIGNIQYPAAGTVGNFAVLDGVAAMINKVNIYVNGQMLNSGSISNFNMVANALQVNNGSIASYVSDESALTGGCEKLKYVLNNTDTPMSAPWYASLSNSPYNFMSGAAVPDDDLFDVLGNLTAEGDVSPALAASRTAGYGYSTTLYPNNSNQTVTIPLSTLNPFFNAYEMLPLFVTREIIIELFWASPVQTFVTDLRTVTAFAGVPVALTSYDIKNIRVSCDLVTCSEEINDLYRLKAASSEGIIIPYDDYALSSQVVTYSGGNRTQQAVLSTSNLKSLLYFRQSDLVHSAQNGWSNSNYLYLGCTNFTVKINNNLTPQTPLVSPQAILTYNMKNRASLNNQLSNCIANNPYVFYRSECIVPVGGADEKGIPASICSFMIYNNFERIFEEIDVGNGVSLANAGSQITVQYTDDQSPTNLTKAKALLNGDATFVGAIGSYTSYMLMTYGKAIIFADGTTQIRG